MTAVEEHLRRWREAGLLSEEEVGRIRAFEAGREPEGRASRPGVIEALVYVGIAVVCVGVFVLVGANWEHLRSWARVAVVAVPGLLALAAGLVMLRSPLGQLQRGGTMAWLAGQGLLTGAIGVLASEAGWSAENGLLVAGPFCFALALALWVGSPSHPQLMGVAAGVVVVAFAFAVRTDERDALLTWGLAVAAAAAGAIALAEARVLVPQATARVLGGLGLALGAYYAGLHEDGPDAAEILVFVAFAALVALSVARGVFAYMLFGVAAGFVGLITVVLRHVGDPTAAALALIVIGVALIGAVLVLTSTRPWTRLPAH
ncbi:MAG: DUF2157 domain-containing protein [Dehalococcoidia bacterium]|nr:DUF2157 domain-containing protein [Dehalococcoidia bacterium]